MRYIRLSIVVVIMLIGLTATPANLLAETEPNDTIDTADPIAIGYTNAESGATLTVNDYDYYYFTAEAGRTYVIETFNIAANASNNATGLWLYNDQGTLLKDDGSSNNGTGVTDARIVYTFAASGTYYILVKDRNYINWTGTYSLRVLPKHDEPGADWDASNDYEPNDARVLANEIKVGLNHAQTHQLAPHTSYVTNNSDYDYYHFTAEAGQTYVIETFDIAANASNYATGLWLYNDQGTLLKDDGYGNNGTGVADARIVHTFAASGIYYILVKDRNYINWTGTYSLRVLPEHDHPEADWDANNEPNDVRVLANELKVGSSQAQTHQLAPHTSYVTNNSDYDYYHFTVEAGQTYVIETFNVAAPSNSRATGLWLYDDQGIHLHNDRYDNNNDGPVDARITHNFITAGTYYILVKDAAYTSWTGEYSVRVCQTVCQQESPTPTPAPPTPTTTRAPTLTPTLNPTITPIPSVIPTLNPTATPIAGAGDPLFPQQWGLPKIGITLNPWPQSQGSSDVTIAVIDTGVDYTHVDLAGGKTLTDSDRDYVNNDADAMDDHGHGTHVAGIAAANTNNGQGIAGVCPNCRILPLKVLDSAGAGGLSNISAAIREAADQGVEVINMSLGGGSCTSELAEAVNYAYNRNVTIVASAGNACAVRVALGIETYAVTYPAKFERVIAVGATDDSDNRADFSNYGSELDVAAPGVGILSTYLNGDYDSLDGTSMASPMVAGLAGLLLSENPTLTPAQVQAILQNSADDLDTPGRDDLTGWGRINAVQALQTTVGSVATAPPAICSSPQESKVTVSSSKEENLYTLYTQLRDEVLRPSDVGVNYVNLFYEHGPELVGILLTNSDLRDRTAQFLENASDEFEALLPNSNSEITLTQTQYEEANRLVQDLAAAGDEDFHNKLDQTWADLALDEDIGKKVTAIWREMNSNDVYLPIIIK